MTKATGRGGIPCRPETKEALRKWMHDHDMPNYDTAINSLLKRAEE